MAKKRASEPEARPWPTDLDTFLADALDFCGDGIYPSFLRYMAELGYSEEEVERLTEQANKKARRG